MLTLTAVTALASAAAARPPKAPPLTAASDGCADHPAAGGAARVGAERPTPRDDLGALDVGRMDRELNLELERLSAARTAVHEEIVVPVHFHVIHAGLRGWLSPRQVGQQLATLNSAYGGRNGGTDTEVRFTLAGAHYSDNAQWFSQPDKNERAFKTALRRGDAGTLNLYSADVGADVLGFSTFPQWQRDKPELDGVVIDYRSIPGGPYRHFDLGYTAVHEIGHWLGLFHTFENGCQSPGDAVDDTPPEADPTEGCPASKDTCTAPGLDPIHNYMDYGWDDCMSEFTPGQAARIRKSWTAYRATTTRLMIRK